jgi:hypothetical protein
MTDMPVIDTSSFLSNCAALIKLSAVCILDSENNLWINKRTFDNTPGIEAIANPANQDQKMARKDP